MGAAIMSEITLKFLRHLRPNGPWVLVAIHPDTGAIEGKTVHDPDGVSEFLSRYLGQRNLYYSLNPPRNAMDKKPSKKDIAAIEYLHTDLDPKEDESPEAAKERYLGALRAFRPLPWAIIDSGNGIQASWKMDASIPLDEAPAENKKKIADAEARMLALVLKLGGTSGTQNIDRILRLPGTINLPNATKRKAGRVRCDTKLLYIDDNQICKLEDFPNEAAEKKEAKKAERAKRHELPQHLRLMLYLTGAHPAGYESRSVLHYTFLLTAMRLGLDDSTIVAACLDSTYAGCSIFEHVQENGGEEFVKRQLERASRNLDLPKGEKILIRLRDGDTDNEHRLIQQALIDCGCPVYARAGELVQPIFKEDKDQQTVTAKFVRYNISRLSDVVAHHAVQFQRFDKKENRWRDTDPPQKHMQMIIEAGHGKVYDTEVGGILTAPTMRPNGSMIIDPGYDPQTKLWYMPPSQLKLPPIGTTCAEAEQALKDLKFLIEECALVSEVDRAVALAAILTVVLRGAFTVAPMFFFHKPWSSSGGTYLSQIVANIALGKDAVGLSVSNDANEFKKELEAAAREAQSILFLNNLTRDLESSQLAQMTSEGGIGVRPFCQNDQIIFCDCRAMTVLVNGNNVVVRGELVRRTLTARIDTGLEDPESKLYTRDPINEFIRADRSKYLAAALTIANAYRNSKKRVKGKVINGFPGWVRTVQEPLLWLGEADPVLSQEEAKVRDPERGALREQVDALVKHFANDPNFEATDVYNKAIANGGAGPANPELFAAFTPDKGAITCRSVGIKLAKTEGRRVGNYSIGFFRKDNHNGHSYRVMYHPEGGAAVPAKERPM
jgi:putative DNA primase/helicase